MSTIIGVFDDKDSAERALREIEDLGFTEEEISLVAKDEGDGDSFIGSKSG